MLNYKRLHNCHINMQFLIVKLVFNYLDGAKVEEN
jgi:hypothetical protein